MPPQPGDAPTSLSFIIDPSTRRADGLRYSFALLAVAGISLGLASLIGYSAPDQAPSDVDSAVLIDLPPAEASSRPASDAADGPQQQASTATPAQAAPQTVEPPKDEPEQPKEQKPDPPQTIEQPPPPVEPDPAAVIEHKQEVVAPPKPVAAPPVQAQDELAPAGSPVPATHDLDIGDEGRPHPSAHAITLWQKSLLRRLEIAKHLMSHEHHAIGTVDVAFDIDDKGAIASERVSHSSGSSSLDKEALLLVAKAAPFPVPPVGSQPKDTSFIVPIRFR